MNSIYQKFIKKGSLNQLLESDLLEIIKYYDNISNLICDVEYYLSDHPTLQSLIISYMYMHNKSDILLEFILDIIKERHFTIEHSMYLYWQVKSNNFKYSKSNLNYKKVYNTYEDIYNRFIDYLNINLYQKYTQNEDVVILTTHQLLSLNHGPTRNVLDHCYVLQKKLNKKVILVVTCEMPRTDEGNFINPLIMNYNNDLNNCNSIYYEGINIELYHPNIEKYTLNTMQEIVKYIYNKKPMLVYNISASSIISDACQIFTNVVTLPCGYNFPTSKGKGLLLGRTLSKEDQQEANFYIRKGHEIIESTFTFKLHPVKEYIHKSAFGVSDETWVMAIVGNRLSSEIDDNFTELLRKIAIKHKKILFLFIGIFEDYNLKIGSDSILKNFSNYIGFQEDLRGVLSGCDLYLNPIRKGGGTSAVEALSVGVPVVTLGLCDVAYASGKEFTCNNLNHYLKTITEYIQNKSKYIKYSKLSIQRAKNLFDTEGVLKNMINKVHSWDNIINKPTHIGERIILNKNMVDELEEDILIRRHIERYAFVRQFAFGKVLDVACGVGYGSYLISKNPDVEHILGVDQNKNSIELARKNFQAFNIEFECNHIEKINGEFDILISLETIEHLENPKILGDLARRCNIKEIVISFPHKKTTHYNPYHIWDIEEIDIETIFRDYACLKKFTNGDSTFMHLIQRQVQGASRKRYLEYNTKANYSNL